MDQRRRKRRPLPVCLFLSILLLYLCLSASADETGSQHMHVWGEPTYTWSDDYAYVTATRICLQPVDEKCIETEWQYTSPEETKKATCTEFGEITFTSNPFVNQAFSVQTITIASTPPLNHTWEEKLPYIWAPDYSTVTGTRICTRCQDIDTETVGTIIESYVKAPTCETGGIANFCSKPFTKDTFIVQRALNISVPALGHDWAAPVYSWAADKSTVTASRFCQRDESHKQQEEAKTTYTVTRKPTYTEEGVGTYTSDTFRNPAFSVQTLNVVLPALDPTPSPSPSDPPTPGPDVTPSPDPTPSSGPSPSPDPSPSPAPSSSPDPTVSPAPQPADIGKARISPVKDQTYTGKAVRPRLSVTYDGRNLTEGTDYTLDWRNNKAVGTASVTLTGINGFTGTRKVSFRIIPRGVELSSLKAGKNKLTVRWKKGSRISGYRIEYSLKKNFKGKKAVTVSGAGSVETDILRLKAGRTYYVRIRTFKKVGKKVYYSAWSRVKKRKVRK